MRILLLNIALLWSAVSISQTTIKGVVKDGNGSPAEAVLISVLNPKDSTIVAYGSTDEQGNYAISFVNGNLKMLLLRMAGFNVKREFRNVANESCQIDWICTEESTLLKEVQIKAQKLWGSKDTLNYLVAAYMRNHDVTIGDIIKRLPGIELKDNGKILYMGIPISKFYIENMDAMQGKYNIATQGIKAEDVATVQVLEHHQHIKALDDQIPPEAAALNLKLKKEKRDVWTGSANIGIGASDRFLWKARANAMMFGKKEQHIMTYGTENDGGGSDMLTSHYGGGGISGNVITSATASPSSPVGRNRRNTYHQLACNNLWKLNDSTELHANASYKYNLVRTRTDSRTVYVMPDGSNRILIENLASESTGNEANFNVTYERNSKREYIRSKTDLAGAWNDMLNDAEYQEHSKYHTLGISNKTHWVHRTEKGNGFELESNNMFASTPQSLIVSPGVFPEQLNDSVPYASVMQTATINRVSSSNSFALINNIRKHRFTFSPTAHANIEHVGINSMLDAGKDFAGSMNYTRLNFGLGLRVRYTLRQFHAQVHLPVDVRPTFITDNNSKSTRTRLYFNPSASFSWRISDNWSGTGNVGWSRTPSSWQTIYGAYVLRNYRSLMRYEGGIYDTESLSGRLKVDYKHIFAQFFAWMEVSAAKSGSDMTYGSRINEQGLSEMMMVHQPNSNSNIQVRGNLRKDFDWKKLSMETTATWSHGNNQYLRQDVLTRYSSNAYAVDGKLSMEVNKWLELNYNIRWSRYRSNTEDGMSRISTEGCSNQLLLNTTIIGNKLWFTFNASHQYDSQLDKKNNFFLSADLRYKMKKLDFTLRASNLLNTRHYYTFTVGDMTESFTDYHLQPLSVMLNTTLRF